MPITRKFIDWSQPALPAVADYLRQQYGRDNILDLDQVVLVFPGGRAGRRLLEVLVEQAAQHDLILLPPHLRTVGTACPNCSTNPNARLPPTWSSDWPGCNRSRTSARMRVAPSLRNSPATTTIPTGWSSALCCSDSIANWRRTP